MSPQYHELLSRLDGVRRRLRLVALASGVVDAAVGLLVTAPAIFLLDNWLHFSTPARLAGCLVILSVFATTFGKRLRVAFRRWRYEQLALRVEQRYPELENRLINTIQLAAAGEAQGPLAAAMIQSLAQETVAETQGRNLRRAIPTRPLMRGALLLLLLGPLAALYPWLFPEQFENAALRIMLPTRAIMPLTRIQLAVQPGDTEVRAGQALSITAAPAGSGSLPRQARIEIDASSARVPCTMAFDGSRFVHPVRDVSTSFKYRVLADDFTSPWYRVRVYDLPRVERLNVRYDYPAYTTLPPATTEGADGNLAALRGTRATVTAWTNLPVAAAAAELKSGATLDARIDAAPEPVGARQAPPKERGSLLTWTVEIQNDDAWQWKLSDAQHRPGEGSAGFTIKALADDPPRVAIVSPPDALTVPRGKDLNILYTAWDDYGVAASRLLLADGSATTRTLSEKKLEKPAKTVNEGCVLKTGAFEVGRQLRLVAVAADANPAGPGAARSAALIIKIGAPEAAGAETSGSLGSILNALARLLETQKTLRNDAGMWIVALGDKKVTPALRAGIARQMTLGQSTLRADARALADTVVEDGAWKKLRADLRALADTEMKQAVGLLEELEKLTAATALQASPAQQKSRATAAMNVQSAIIAALERLIAALAAAHPELKGAAGDEKKTETRPKPGSLQDMHNALADYIEEHQGTVNTLQKMENVDPKNFSTTQTQTMDDLAKTEEQWAQYMKDCKDWLRESPMVKGTESGLKDELNEMFNEVDKLPEALRHQPVEIKVKEEENGVELASKIAEDLEKWLPEEPDYQKWMMENSSKDYDVPLADLPDQLEDMIGDLIESEQDMTAANEDQTSNWADSMSQAGWGAADGPISNYSAKGVTGNIQPNDIDISGRSGEGRTGRSLGEMVESVATGKGGRDTQTRLTNDAMGDGQVQDLSTEQTKGATGGGKVAGTTGYGLVSPTAPVQPEVLQKMAQRQADLKMKAVNLQEALARMRLAGASLDRSIQGMGQVQQALQNGRYETLKDLGATVVQDLKDQRRVVRDQLRLRREGDAKGGKKVQTKVTQTNPENYPEEYRDMISAYYEALSTEKR